MKKILLPLLSLLIFSCNNNTQTASLSTKDRYREMVNHHPYNNRKHLSEEQMEGMDPEDRPDLAWEQNYLATMDPALGRPAPERLNAVYAIVAQNKKTKMLAPGSASSPWVERGPNNVGGRTRTIAYDPNDTSHTKVWAGGVTGGLWVNNNISNSNSQWVAVNDFWDNIAITSIAFDPTNTNIIYVGTGEGWGTGSSRGAGIWKSTDDGVTWTHLSSTSTFYFVNDLAVRNEGGSGVLYVALRGNYHAQQWHGTAAQGLQRSTNGGISFTQVLPNIPGKTFNYAAADIEIGANNKLWVGTTTTSYGGSDRGGGRILTSDDGTSWTVSYNHSGGERVEVACAPSDSNYVYAIIESGGAVDAIVRTTNSGSSWSSVSKPIDADNGISANDFSRGQAWYDLILAVDPNNKNTVLTGAVDLFKTTNGGTTWSQLSHWYGGFGYPEVHADQHAIVYKPGSSSEVLFGNDGGIFRTTDVNGFFPGFTQNNSGYNVTQFYACAIHPTAGSNYFLAGAQDNGSHQFNSTGVNSTLRVTGGDGAFCFIDQSNSNYQITSYVYNSYWRSVNGGLSFGINRIQNDQSTGKFINPADYDDNLHMLYSARTSSTINRIKNIIGIPVVSNFNVSGMNSMASHIRVSPYSTTSTTLFVGTEAGDLYKITNADGSSPTTSSIGGGLPAGNISCVEIGANDNELLVTFTNYGVTSVWYTTDGGTNWINKEGNLPDMPVRWALFNPNNRHEVILATEVGVWSTSNFNSTNPTWTSSSSGLANVRVDMLQMRQSDYEVIAATYGRGLFSSNAFASPSLPAAYFSADNLTPCLSDTVTFADSSSGGPTSWKWSFSPSTITFVNGTADTSANPQVVFNGAGTYDVSLVSTNLAGSDSSFRSSFISASSNIIPTVNITAADTTICAGSMASFVASATGGGNNPVYHWQVNGGAAGTNSPIFSTSSLSEGDLVSLSFSSSSACASNPLLLSNTITMHVHQIPVVNLSAVMNVSELCKDDTLTIIANVNNFGNSGHGQFFGPGMVGNQFIASLAGNGIHTIYYSYSLDSTGCSTKDSMQLEVKIVPKPTISQNGSILTCNQTGFDYQWFYNGQPVTGGINQTLNLIGNGLYSVRLSNGNCFDNSAALSVQNTGMAELPAGVKFSLYPNPAADLMYLELENLQQLKVEVEIIDLQGKIFLRKTLSGGSNIMEPIHIEHMAKGLYALKLHIGDNLLTKRFEKK